MQLSLQLSIPALNQPIVYTDHILLLGSCFTEHIAGKLSHHKFRVLQNPNGILFNPLSVANALNSYLERRTYTEADFFQLNGTWNSWQHHSQCSHTDLAEAITGINNTQQQASDFVKKAGWVMITLGSAFQYYLKEGNIPVANNHRAPAQWFEKRLLPVEEIVATMTYALQQLLHQNPQARILFTISPVRHIRDGVVDNNRSKARLIEAVHTLCEQLPACHYFPSYELVMDILRDYRFYDIDFVHPNYLATEYVWQEFRKACIDPTIFPIMEAVKDIMTARAHRPRFPGTESHQKFIERYALKVHELMEQHPFLDLQEELTYFTLK